MDTKVSIYGSHKDVTINEWNDILKPNDVFLSLDYSFSSSLFTITKSIYLFHSIFMILLFILLNNILSFIHKKGSSQKDTSSILFGFLFF